MNTFFAVLFSVWAVASAGIYSAKWPATGDVPARVSLRSGLGMRWVDSSSQYLSTPDLPPNDLVNTDTQDLGQKNIRSAINPLEEPVIKNGNVETLEIPVSSTAQIQRNRRQEIDPSKYIAIGSIYNESPKFVFSYQPKHVRSITLVEETDNNGQNTYFEAPEAPISTVRTPKQASDSYQSSNLGKPIVLALTNYGPAGFPGHLDHHQSTLSPVNEFPAEYTGNN